jgi:catechol 2,3-dioxygenase-like lactoylglutathione lyase family enzyme
VLNRLSVTTIWVLDQNEALRFYTEKLGFDICADVTNGDFRWLTVGLKTQPELEFQLAAVKPSHALTQEEVDSLTKLVEAGQLGIGPWITDDCQATYETFTARGVEFIQPPTDRPYGTIEAIFKDNSGNIMVISQPKSRGA